MPDRGWRVAVIDSGISAAALQAGISRIKRFVDQGDRIVEREPVEDPIGHGTVVAAIISSSARPVQLLAGQVLNERGLSTAATLAAAIDWALAQGTELLHFSLGLPYDRPPLRFAIERAIAAEVLVVAAMPARGGMAYPASYSGVIRATGDARCVRDEISYLGTNSVDFGGCPIAHPEAGRMSRGASMGAAHLSRYIVSHIPPGLPRLETWERLIRLARFRGLEKHESRPIPVSTG